jgi:hypothetical protein
VVFVYPIVAGTDSAICLSNWAFQILMPKEKPQTTTSFLIITKDCSRVES